MAKEEAVAGEGNGIPTRTQVLKLTSKLNGPEIDDSCIASSSLGLAPVAKLVRLTCSKSSIAFSNRFHIISAWLVISRPEVLLILNLVFSVLWQEIDKNKLSVFCVTSSDIVMSAMHSEISYTTLSLLCK